MHFPNLCAFVCISRKIAKQFKCMYTHAIAYNKDSNNNYNTEIHIPHQI